MSVGEQERHALSIAARETFGEQQGNTLMAMLPPVGWADVATKEYVDQRLETLENRLVAAFERSLRGWALGLFVGLGSLTISMAAVVVAAIALS